MDLVALLLVHCLVHNFIGSIWEYFAWCLKQIVHLSGDCGSPVAPQNGTLESYTNTSNGSEVFYSCDPGLVPVGRMRTVCTENGWSPNPVDLNCTVGML